MIAQSTLHGWRHPKCLVDANEVAVHEMKGDGVGVIVDLLGETICQASEAAHVHPHGEVLALYIAGADMFGIGIPADSFHVAADADCGRVSRFILYGSTINLVQLGIIAVHSECPFDGLKVCLVSIGCDLNAAFDSAGAILHKILRPVCTASADEVAHDELGLCINSDPSPNISPANLFFRSTNVFGLCSDICPYFIALQSADRQVSDVLVVVVHTFLTEIDEQLGDGIPSNAGHPRRGADTVSLHQSRHNPDSLVDVQRIHIEHYA